MFSLLWERLNKAELSSKKFSKPRVHSRGFFVPCLGIHHLYRRYDITQPSTSVLENNNEYKVECRRYGIKCPQMTQVNTEDAANWILTTFFSHTINRGLHAIKFTGKASLLIPKRQRILNEHRECFPSRRRPLIKIVKNIVFCIKSSSLLVSRYNSTIQESHEQFFLPFKSMLFCAYRTICAQTQYHPHHGRRPRLAGYCLA